MWRDYLIPTTIEEALRLLARYEGDARLIAGGTDLVLQCQRNECPARVLVDVTHIPGLDSIAEVDGWIVLGATVTHAQVADSAVIRQKAGLLAHACSVVGGPQIRNVGTLAGNFVTALPAADGALALTALDAEAEVTTLDGARWVPLLALQESVGVCRVNPCAEMVTALRIRPLGPEYRSAHERIARRKEHALPILNVGAVGAVRDGRFHDVRIAIGPVAVKPLRLSTSEAALEGQPAGSAAIQVATELVGDQCHPRDSLLRGSGRYRQALAGVLVRRALERVAGISSPATI
jgi:CO/xanthine dehydrogenase FAD-binding subunit